MAMPAQAQLIKWGGKCFVDEIKGMYRKVELFEKPVFVIKFCYPVVTPIGNIDGAFFAVPVSLIAFLIGSRFGKEYTRECAKG